MVVGVAAEVADSIQASSRAWPAVAPPGMTSGDALAVDQVGERGSAPGSTPVGERRPRRALRSTRRRRTSDHRR